MTQPSFVPITEADVVRPAASCPFRHRGRPTGPLTCASLPSRGVGHGSPGPDQGFALRLAKRFADRLHLTPGENVEDVEVGVALLAARRAALFGRAPCIYDLDFAYTLWGFLFDGPEDLVARRKAVFARRATTTLSNASLWTWCPRTPTFDSARATWRPGSGSGVRCCGTELTDGDGPRASRDRRKRSHLQCSSRRASRRPPRPVAPRISRDSWSWRFVLDQLAGAGYRAVALDQRGYSTFARPDGVEAYRLAHLVDDVVGVADTMEWPTFDLVVTTGAAWSPGSPPPATPVGCARSPRSRPAPGALRAVAAERDADQAGRSSYIALFRRPSEPEALLLGEDGSGSGIRQLFAESGLGDEGVEEYLRTLLEPGP